MFLAFFDLLLDADPSIILPGDHSSALRYITVALL